MNIYEAIKKRDKENELNFSKFDSQSKIFDDFYNKLSTELSEQEILNIFSYNFNLISKQKLRTLWYRLYFLNYNFSYEFLEKLAYVYPEQYFGNLNITGRPDDKTNFWWIFSNSFLQLPEECIIKHYDEVNFAAVLDFYNFSDNLWGSLPIDFIQKHSRKIFCTQIISNETICKLNISDQNLLSHNPSGRYCNKCNTSIDYEGYILSCEEVIMDKVLNAT